MTVALALAPAASWAQQKPSAEQIINSLVPTERSLAGPRRGIRPVNETAAAVPAAPASPMPGVRPRAHASVQSAPPPAAEAPSVNLYVEFATGSSELTPDAMTSLDELGKALSSNTLASYRFRIEGHTDTVGARDANQALSERRAAAVAAYIEHKFGVNEGRLQAVGLGSGHPLVPTPDQTPEARNRRVQVINLGA